MRIGSYLKDRMYFIVIQFLAIGFVCFILQAFDISRFAIAFIGLVLFIANVVGLYFEYIKKKEYYSKVEKNMATLDKKHMIGELIDRPSFSEGAFLYDVVMAATKSMNDNIAQYRIESQEYREYIETWVHEVKTPIAAGRLIVENNKSESTLSIAEELNKIDGFVEQALYYSKSSNLEKDYIIKEIELEDLVKTAVKKYSKALIESRVSLELKDLGYMVYTDQKWMDFILGQIITNAIKYRKDNAKITFSAQAGEHHVALNIEDNGIGITEKDIGKVFEKGFTGENGRRFAKSTGIGLYLCSKLCNKMGLQIQLNSQKGIGTKITIVFPKSAICYIK